MFYTTTFDPPGRAASMASRRDATLPYAIAATRSHRAGTSLGSYARVSDRHRQQAHPQTIEWISSGILAEPVEAHAVR